MSAEGVPEITFADSEPTADRRCRNCESHLMRQTARVLGDNQGRVHACPECTTYRELHEKASDAGGDA